MNLFWLRAVITYLLSAVSLTHPEQLQLQHNIVYGVSFSLCRFDKTFSEVLRRSSWLVHALNYNEVEAFIKNGVDKEHAK